MRTVIDAFTLRNAGGAEVRAMADPATIVSVRVPDRGRYTFGVTP